MCVNFKFDISLIVASTLTETRQFFTLYNTLEDQKAFMEKEVCLSCMNYSGILIVSLKFGILNQIHENFDM